ncbi:hypothetical protein [Chamaesiphon sp. VAR_48_metabat_135_sub]|uniref:hypothetical protein n=1 Tax=Chamaesiphon sp. VAR_48_metabat_135_sub TaxID=2964699 RepID=UPI00286AB417|nr:hypothetical protein [Chamaesiphon sp. VAR_48_metabat_135_sub]
MKKVNPKYLLVSLLIISLFNTRSAISQSERFTNAQERKTVKDYFLNLPANYIKITPGGRQMNRLDRTQLLQRGGTIVDINNGYLRTTGDTCFHEIVIFKRSKRSPFIAINTACTMGDSIAIVDPDRNWKDITIQVFPMQTLKTNNDMGVTIKLPRQGKVITISEGDPTVRWQIEFKNDRFQSTKTF